jgi:uncharacterized protein (TIGR01777 family)
MGAALTRVHAGAMKIAITGATGFIGRPLAALLLERGHELVVLARRPSLKAPTGLTTEHYDALEPPRPGLLRGVDALVHLAGAPIAERWTAAHKAKILQTRVEATRALARAAVEAGTVRTMVSASAIGYYGAHGDEPLSEDAPAGHDFLAKVCVGWEAATTRAREAGIRVVTPRFGVVLHPEGGALQKLLTPFKVGVGGPMGSGEQIVSWIHRGDLVALIAFLLDRQDLSGPVNATAPVAVTNRELARTLGRVLRRPAVLATPAFALKLALGEMSSMLLTGQRVVPTRALAAGFEFAHPTLEDALRSLLT